MAGEMIKTNYLTICLAMLIAVGLAFGLTPRERLAEHGPKVIWKP